MPDDPASLGEPSAEPDADTAEAALIVDGEITDLESFESDTLGVYTLARIRVARVVAGALADSEITIEVRGGTIGEHVTLVSHHPFLQLGTRARFYLDPLFTADAEAIASNSDAEAWALERVVHGLRNGSDGMIELARPGEPGMLTEALCHGSPPEAGVGQRVAASRRLFSTA